MTKLFLYTIFLVSLVCHATIFKYRIGWENRTFLEVEKIDTNRISSSSIHWKAIENMNLIMDQEARLCYQASEAPILHNPNVYDHNSKTASGASAKSVFRIPQSPCEFNMNLLLFPVHHARSLHPYSYQYAWCKHKNIG